MLTKQQNNNLHKLLDERKFDKARSIIYRGLEKLKGKETKSAFLKIAGYHGFLIDLGAESYNEADLTKAITFLEKCEVKIGEYLNKQSFYYNLANAKHGIARIHLSKNRGVQQLQVYSEKLQPPINYYWLAFKHLKENRDGLKHQILINLSISLCDSGRIIEALQFLDIVLKESPNYPQALISRADTLHFLSWATNCSPTISLYNEIYECNLNGISTGQLPDSLRERCIQNCILAVRKIESYGFDIKNLKKERKVSEREFKKHSEYRKFCLEHFISLNEHAIYCGCIASTNDDLTIGVKHARFKGKIVPKLELLLNRLKSEFDLARRLLYQSQYEKSIPETVLYSELLDGEVINSRTEMLRSSFRICYGILDKIAFGICKFYQLSEKGENILFESFWNPRSKPERWNTLNSLKNIHLGALYSIACDLNTKTGELKHFKNWRNKLEHNVLILKDGADLEGDLLGIYDDPDFFETVDINDFKSKTFHLLQLTRSAIFSFVYCIRLETIEELNEDKNAFIVSFK